MSTAVAHPQEAVMVTFEEAADSSQLLGSSALLAALVRIYDRLAASMTRPSRRLMLRCPTDEDISAETDQSPLLLDFDAFESLSRAVFR